MLIAQLTDLHVRPRGKPANRVVETNMFTERAFRALAAFVPRPEVVLLTGDLTECGLNATRGGAGKPGPVLEQNKSGATGHPFTPRPEARIIAWAGAKVEAEASRAPGPAPFAGLRLALAPAASCARSGMNS